MGSRSPGVTYVTISGCEEEGGKGERGRAGKKEEEDGVGSKGWIARRW